MEVTTTKTKKKSTKTLTLNQAEEQHLLAVSNSATKKKISKIKSIKADTAMVEKKDSKIATTSMPTENNELQSLEVEEELHQEELHQDELRSNCDSTIPHKDITTAKKKTKSKNKKRESEKQNISMKTSFNKFDALQKRNLIHVRSIDAGTAQEKFSNIQGEQKKNCHLCDNPVYTMEEVKAEKNMYHKNCFRCHTCNKQLKLDSYQSHEGVLYCTIHFKLLFAPKLIEDDESVPPQKPELIIRENQPAELRPDVVRASDKPDLGLEELHQLNVRSRFQVFENGIENKSEEKERPDLQRSGTKNAISSAIILSKLAKLQQLGSSKTKSQDSLNESDSNEDTDSLDSDDPNTDIIRQKKRMQKHERPIGLGEAMNDIRTLFEKGHGITKEERREERKQEIQNIRSRLFMGKQARIKEMYQQAVADSEQGAVDKKPDIAIEVDSKSLRERFENGGAKIKNTSDNENEGDNSKKSAVEREAEVFELGISKKSRSIFMELDANVINGKKNSISPSQPSNKNLANQKTSSKISGSTTELEPESTVENDVVKCGETIEDIPIQTSEISEKFKFFETYRTPENKKRVFRITPPRDGVVKMPSPDNNCSEEEQSNESADRHAITHSRTTSMMINKFRELEKNSEKKSDHSPKPLKCFTPPPNDNRRLYDVNDSDGYADDDNEEDSETDEYDDDDDDDDFYNYSHSLKEDEALKEAQNAARAKQLRLKFEKWQANEIRNENDNDRKFIGISNTELDDNSIESTQSIRERFEKMRNEKQTPQPAIQRHQVNRFV